MNHPVSKKKSSEIIIFLKSEKLTQTNQRVWGIER